MNYIVACQTPRLRPLSSTSFLDMAWHLPSHCQITKLLYPWLAGVMLELGPIIHSRFQITKNMKMIPERAAK